MPHIPDRIAFDQIGRRHRSGNPAAIKPSAGIATSSGAVSGAGRARSRSAAAQTQT
jgi:hypothetical protein